MEGVQECHAKLNSMEMLLTCIMCKGPPTLYSELQSKPCGRQENCWGSVEIILFLILSMDSVYALAICIWTEEPQPSPEQHRP